MPTPTEGPTTTELVAARLKQTSPAEDLAPVVAAINDVVRGLPVATPPTDEEGVVAEWEEWPGRVVEGATMLAARVYRRRNSPAGVETFGDLGPVYVQRNDPDIAMLLQLGRQSKPAVG